MDPFDRFLRRPFDEVLVSQGLLLREKADELLAAAKESSEPFVCVLVDTNTMTAWDVAKVIATTYQMPVHPLAGYRFEKGLFEGLSSGTLLRWLVVPLGIFGRTRTFAVAEPPSRELLDELQTVCGPNLFFFAAELPEVQRVLRDNVKVVDAAKDSGWQKLFDSAEQAIETELTGKKAR